MSTPYTVTIVNQGVSIATGGGRSTVLAFAALDRGSRHEALISGGPLDAPEWIPAGGVVMHNPVRDMRGRYYHKDPIMMIDVIRRA